MSRDVQGDRPGLNLQRRIDVRKVVVSEFVSLVDEYRLMVFPMIIGSGKRLFENVSDSKVLRLSDTKTLSSGVVVLSYEPAGE